MHPNISCVIKACENLGITYKILSEHENFLQVDLGKPTYFINSVVPFNRADLHALCRDKDYGGRVVSPVITMPFTKSFLDPGVSEDYTHLLTHRSVEEIAMYVDENFSFPVIVKKNKGSRGNNVFSCENKEEVKTALEMIFNREVRGYDYIALVQEKVAIAREYRVITYKEKVKLVYEKDTSTAEFSGNLSPLHWDGAKAVPCNDEALIERIENFVAPLFSVFDLTYGGLDVVEDMEGNLWLIEINSHPQFGIFIRDNGEETIVKMFEGILADQRG